MDWTGQQQLRICALHLLKKSVMQTVVKPKESKEHLRSMKMDQDSDGKIYGNSLLCWNHGGWCSG